jgi:hypothetical protein
MTPKHLPWVIGVLSLAAASCGSSAPASPTTPTTPSTPATVAETYSGTVAAGAEAGSIELTAQVPVAALALGDGQSRPFATATAVGTLRLMGGKVVALTGTYDTVTKKFTMSGGGYSITATLFNGELGGIFITPTGQNGTVIAAPIVPGVTTLTYCGKTAGDVQATIVLTRTDNKLVGIGHNPAPDGSQETLKGTITGTSVSFSFGPSGGQIGTFTGTLNGTTMSGSWNTTLNGKPDESGTWSVSTTGCQ